jgi:3-hydroxyacyl-CoA dehydrogenase/enoyl-CoA hydratase/3-hydroxybutyryl-CoA epimerase
MNTVTMIKVEKDSNNIATIWWDCGPQPVNSFSEESTTQFVKAVEELLIDVSVKGVVIASKKQDFHSGADLKMLQRLFEASPEKVFEDVRQVTLLLRKMEKSGKPFVAAIGGHALGGGLELALACHARIVADQSSIKIGLPEVKLGLMPGFGGTQRLPRMVGAVRALKLIGEGRTLSPKEALSDGIVTEVVPIAELLVRAKSWILENPIAAQPWDKKGFKIPGGTVQSPIGVQTFAGASATTRKLTFGNYPAAVGLLDAIYHGLQLPYEPAQERESRIFVSLVKSSTAKAMVNTLFFGINAANSLKARPQDIERRAFKKVGVVGAGLMGAGIAYVAAQKGMTVILIDQTLEAASRGKQYSEKLCATATSKGRISASTASELLARIQPTMEYQSLAECDIVIEAVFEDRALKESILAKVEAAVSENTIIATNTSTLPIAGLATALKRPERFVGLHFFSPVEKMPLVEVISGRLTSKKTLAESLDLIKSISKTPISVGDGRAFFTTRVFASYVTEGLAMLEEGCSPALLENSAKACGMPMGPLRLADMINIDLIVKISDQTKHDLGNEYLEHPGVDVARRMVALGRLGEKTKAGFYEYQGSESKIWTGLAQTFPNRKANSDSKAIGARLLKAQAMETQRCLEEGVVKAHDDANVGSILGWGFPPFTGGVAMYLWSVNTQESDVSYV